MQGAGGAAGTKCGATGENSRATIVAGVARLLAFGHGVFLLAGERGSNLEQHTYISMRGTSSHRIFHRNGGMDRGLDDPPTLNAGTAAGAGAQNTGPPLASLRHIQNSPPVPNPRLSPLPYTSVGHLGPPRQKPCAVGHALHGDETGLRLLPFELVWSTQRDHTHNFRYPRTLFSIQPAASYDGPQTPHQAARQPPHSGRPW